MNKKIIKYAFKLYFLGIWIDTLHLLLVRRINARILSDKNISDAYTVQLSKYFEILIYEWNLTEKRYILAVMSK